ncbi:hypothetical protein [Cumulibacter soli]|uniref:hypothetical protein n=1 Tax=Cumulibacter soli TaxID=2546344 RepID=UPI001067FFF0|nr:hypothetical protein [Cumulibacter soli]
MRLRERSLLVAQMRVKGMNTSDLAREACCSVQLVSFLTTTGKSQRNTCSLVSAQKIAGALGIATSALFEASVVHVSEPSIVPAVA